MRIQRVTALLVVALILPVSASFASPAPAPDPTLANLSALRGPAFDVAFLRAAVPDDDEAVELAMTATLYADHADLLRWNQDFAEREHAQIREMLALLGEFGTGPTERKEGVATASVKKLRALRGPALERTYIALMTRHFDRSMALAKLAAQRADRPALRTFATNAAAVDRQDEGTLRGWLARWYH
ncbi:MAG TPA: DUF305 domain-containing protein [bacterium]|nr:DUF305 domain-containing protein [bacterium]